jgi:D-alanine-D-alanine ligase
MRVVVLMGGISAERAVSLTTGSGIAAALRRLGHEVISLDAAGGRELPAGQEAEMARLESDSGKPGAIVATGEDAEHGTGSNAALVKVPALGKADAVLIALHGGAGEDGTLQALLELTGVPYTGSGMLACALAMDKAMSKRVFEHAGIPTPRWILLPADGPAPLVEDLDPLGGLPVVVKPNDQGSTVGLTIVREAQELARAFEEAARFSKGVLAETYIPGRELTVSILGGEALPIVEIFPEHGVYDYTCKYTSGKSRYEVPARLDPDLAARIQELGLRAFTVLGCRGVARVDFRLDPGDRAYCLEVNTVPGMTPTSLVPMAAGARGISYDELVGRMVELALEQAGRKGAGTPAR